MARIVVCDTGPLLHLSEAGAINFLRDAGQIYIPPIVAEEFERNAAGFFLPDWVQVLPLGNLAQKQAKKWTSDEVNIGEAQAIALAVQEKSDWLLSDDGFARRFAESLGLEVHGSIGLLLWAVANSQITTRAQAHHFLDMLARSSLWVSEKVLNKAHSAVDELLPE